MFLSTALDIVISTQVVVGSRPLKYEREAQYWGGSADRDWIPWFTGHDTPGRVHWLWQPEMWECRLILRAHCRMISFEYLNQWNLLGWHLESVCVNLWAVMHSNTHIHLTLYLLHSICLCYNLLFFPSFVRLHFIIKYCLADSSCKLLLFIRKGCLSLIFWYVQGELNWFGDTGNRVGILTVTFCNSDAMISCAGSALYLHILTLITVTSVESFLTTP